MQNSEVNPSPIVPLARSKDQLVPRPDTVGQMESPRGTTQGSDEFDLGSQPPRFSRPLAASIEDSHDSRPRTAYEEDFHRGERKRGCMGCLRFLLNCRCLFTGCFLFVVVTAVALVLLITQKPAFIYNPLKDFLNAGLEQNEVPVLGINQVYTDLNKQVEAFEVGENTLVISEAQLRALVQDKLRDSNLHQLNLDLRDGTIKIYTNIEQPQYADKPLWLVVEISEIENQPQVTKIGSERIPLPAFLNEAVQKLLFSVLDLAGQDMKLGFVGIVLPLPDNIEFKDLRIKDDKLELDIDVSTGLEGVFGDKQEE